MGYKYPKYVYVNLFQRIRSRIVYGLQAEHTMEDQVYWRGNGGKVYFYQNELSYINPYYWKRGLAPDRSPVFEFPSIESRSNDTPEAITLAWIMSATALTVIVLTIMP